MWRFFRKHDLGSWGEEFVASLYKQKGYKILSRNYFERRGRRLGEIDVVAVRDRGLVFVEVKTRTSDKFGSPAEAVSAFKQRRLVRSCKQFMCSHPEFSGYDYRIDVVEVKTNLDRNKKSVKIIENAVEDSQ